MTMEVKFPNERYEEYSNEELFMEIVHMVCEMRARYDKFDEMMALIDGSEPTTTVQ